MEPPASATLDLVDGEGLAAVASLWRKTGRELRARFGGASMQPALPPGTEVLLRCGEAGGPGDVIAFLAGGHLLVHRVVARAADGGWILTRGDARVLPDVPILDPGDVVGRVAGIFRSGSLDGVPVAEDSLLRRLTLAMARAALRVSPRSGAAGLRAIHTLRRLAWSVASLARGRRPPDAP